MSDLTERLAAKLEAKGFVQFDAVLIGHKAHTVLPLLLSEPELVAGLSPEVKREVLRQLLGERIDELKHRRSGGIADRVSFDLGTTAASSSASIEADLLLDTLAPSPAPMEGTNDE